MYGTYRFGKPVLNIRNPDIVGQIMVKKFRHFVDRLDDKAMKLFDGGDLDQVWIELSYYIFKNFFLKISIGNGETRIVV